MKILEVYSAKFGEDGYGETTVVVKTDTVTFYVQTVDGKYRPSLNCLISTDEKGEIDEDDYSYIETIIEEAEEHAESLLDLDNLIENPNYLNKIASPYQRRFLAKEE
jgi:hypothetical protein